MEFMPGLNRLYYDSLDKKSLPCLLGIPLIRTVQKNRSHIEEKALGYSYSSFNDLMGYTNKKLPYNILASRQSRIP
jgi:hypothetical protein